MSCCPSVAPKLLGVHRQPDSSRRYFRPTVLEDGCRCQQNLWPRASVRGGRASSRPARAYWEPARRARTGRIPATRSLLTEKSRRANCVLRAQKTVRARLPPWYNGYCRKLCTQCGPRPEVPKQRRTREITPPRLRAVRPVSLVLRSRVMFPPPSAAEPRCPGGSGAGGRARRGGDDLDLASQFRAT